MFDDEDLFNFGFDEEEEKEPYPESFYNWDKSLNEDRISGYYEADELCEIIEIYLDENEVEKAKTTIDYTLKIYPDDDDLVYDILSLLNDYELWNDLLIFSEKYAHLPEVWADGHRITALLHLGMEEDTFHFFRKLKTKYADDEESLSIIYQAMGEALYEVDLYEAAIQVIDEACNVLGEDIDFLWLKLHCFVTLDKKEESEAIAEKIAQMSPFDPQNWYRLGAIYQDINDMEKSIEAFEFALNLGLNTRENLVCLIHSYEKNGNYEKALEKAKDYVNLYPDNYLIYIIASNICSQIEKWGEAIVFLDEAIRLEPSLDSLYLYKSACYVYLGEQAKAKLTLGEGIEKTKDPESALQKELEKLNDNYPEV